MMITKLLGISPDKYSELVFALGCEWLEAYVGSHNSLLIQSILETTEFWAWWNSQMHNTNDYYMTCAAAPDIDEWMSLHKYPSVKGILPKIVLTRGYNNMIGKEAIHA
jgi:hypothetical protein